ncbi:MAG: U32 family peptidase, partial [Prevotellaceae bacterium]|nr:U32 family peptidase [Prevotellaceae bacterium]
MRKIELLSPAKNLECGKAAVLHGADAVYIGAPKFGARAAAGNSIQDIEQLAAFAHRFDARVYAALNTILTDSELEEAQRLIWNLYHAGADAVIVQDMGILQLDLPPIALHASTQTDNRTAEKARFLEKAGFSQIVLARELSLTEIKNITSQVQIPVEVFVYGALCVSYSGQCYLSHALGSRSANRGECAQCCRLPYNLVDANGNILAKNKYLLSLKDLNLSDYLEELLDAGVSSFKIEGRLKDMAYVKNVTAFYRQKLDEILDNKNSSLTNQPAMTKSSSGKITYFFQPDVQKTF